MFLLNLQLFSFADDDYPKGSENMNPAEQKRIVTTGI
jgi:hypothetical protein